MTLACAPAGGTPATEFDAAARQAVSDSIRTAADSFIASIGNGRIEQFMAHFTTDGDLTYVDNGKIYPTRDALAAAAGGFFTRIGTSGGTWDDVRIIPLSRSAGTFTGIFRPQMTDTAGVPLWVEGKIWTLVYEQRAGRWVIVQAHEINAKP